MTSPFDSAILPAPVVTGESQSLSGTLVDIPGIGKIVFAPSSASDFPDMQIDHGELVMRYWAMRIELDDALARLDVLERKNG